MYLKDIIKTIETFAPLSYQESYDNSGLIVGNPSDKVNGVLICLDSTEQIIDEAIEKKCNLIIAHHPIIFEGLRKLNGKNYIERVIIKAIKNNISIYACHTNLDNIINGVNLKIAQKIGLKNHKVLQPKKNKLKKIVTYCPVNKADEVREAMFNAGGGNIGNYSNCSFNSLGKGSFKGNENSNPVVGNATKLHWEEELKIEMISTSDKASRIISAMLETHPYEEVAYDVYNLENYSNEIGSGLIGELEVSENEKSFLERIKVDLNTACIRHTQLLNRPIKKVAVCGGSGSFLLPQAKALKADVFITADFKYHQFFDAEDQIIVADIGHYESEQYTCELFFEILSEKIPNFAIYLSEKNTNPVNYL